MSKIPSYPKIWALGHPNIEELMKDSVTIEEKVDGSQFSFGILGGELCCRSKGQDIILERPEGMFELAIQRVREIEKNLTPDWIYRCEYLMKPKHNTIAYSRAPEKNLVLLDVQTGLETYMSNSMREAEATLLGLECVPVLNKEFCLTLDNAEEPIKFLQKESFLGGALIEGIVIKNYKRFGKDGKALMGKYVSEVFKEQHSKDWKKTSPKKLDVMGELLLDINLEARWTKALLHLREKNALESSLRDIPALIDEAVSDGVTELEDLFKKELWAWALPQVRRKLVKGLPDWYKKTLMEKQFEVKNETE